MLSGRDLDSEHVVSVVSHVDAGHAIVFSGSFGVGNDLGSGLGEHISNACLFLLLWVEEVDQAGGLHEHVWEERH